jgi:hypothetical protein
MRNITLNVKYQAQIATGCRSGNYCCGLAAINMATAFVHGVTPKAEYLVMAYEFLGMNSCCTTPKRGTNIFDQLKVAKEIGRAGSSYAGTFKLDYIKNMIQARCPVVTLIDYKILTGAHKCQFDYFDYHSIVIRGYDEKKGIWRIVDPLCNSSSGFKEIPSKDFRNAVSSARAAIPEGFALVVIVRK